MTDITSGMSQKYIESDNTVRTIIEKGSKKVQADMPYPPIKVERPSLKYAHILSFDFAASNGELTAITQYLYQNWILRPKYQDIAEITKDVAKVEMHHLQILGNLIVLLGGKPTYGVIKKSNQKEYIYFWSGDMLLYTTILREAMINNIKMERQAINTYQAHMKIIKDRHVNAILERIIADELIHLNIFKNILKTI